MEKRSLGRTDLAVSPLGLGSSYGATEDMVLEAYDSGINYFYWGALRTRGMARGIRSLAKTKREQMVIAVQASKMDLSVRSMVLSNLRKLQIDYFDVLILGWRDERPSQRIIDSIHSLQEDGLVRWLGVSAHDRPVFVSYEEERLFDVFHVRYNAAHRGAEREVFPHLSADERPGIVAFTCTRWGGLLRPSNMPPGEPTPVAADCYRFSLSHPMVDCAITGPNSPEQLRQNLAALDKGLLSKDETAWMKRVGDHVHEHVPGMIDNVRGAFTIGVRGLF